MKNLRQVITQIRNSVKVYIIKLCRRFWNYLWSSTMFPYFARIFYERTIRWYTQPFLDGFFSHFSDRHHFYFAGRLSLFGTFMPFFKKLPYPIPEFFTLHFFYGHLYFQYRLTLIGLVDNYKIAPLHSVGYIAWRERWRNKIYPCLVKRFRKWGNYTTLLVWIPHQYFEGDCRFGKTGVNRLHSDFVKWRYLNKTLQFIRRKLKRYPQTYLPSLLKFEQKKFEEKLKFKSPHAMIMWVNSLLLHTFYNSKPVSLERPFTTTTEYRKRGPKLVSYRPVLKYIHSEQWNFYSTKWAEPVSRKYYPWFYPKPKTVGISSSLPIAEEPLGSLYDAEWLTLDSVFSHMDVQEPFVELKDVFFEDQQDEDPGIEEYLSEDIEDEFSTRGSMKGEGSRRFHLHEDKGSWYNRIISYNWVPRRAYKYVYKRLERNDKLRAQGGRLTSWVSDYSFRAQVRGKYDCRQILHCGDGPNRQDIEEIQGNIEKMLYIADWNFFRRRHNTITDTYPLIEPWSKRYTWTAVSFPRFALHDPSYLYVKTRLATKALWKRGRGKVKIYIGFFKRKGGRFFATVRRLRRLWRHVKRCTKNIASRFRRPKPVLSRRTLPVKFILRHEEHLVREGLIEKNPPGCKPKPGGKILFMHFSGKKFKYRRYWWLKKNWVWTYNPPKRHFPSYGPAYSSNSVLVNKSTGQDSSYANPSAISTGNTLGDTPRIGIWSVLLIAFLLWFYHLHIENADWPINYSYYGEFATRYEYAPNYLQVRTDNFSEPWQWSNGKHRGYNWCYRTPAASTLWHDKNVIHFMENAQEITFWANVEHSINVFNMKHFLDPPAAFKNTKVAHDYIPGQIITYLSIRIQTLDERMYHINREYLDIQSPLEYLAEQMDSQAGPENCYQGHPDADPHLHPEFYIEMQYWQTVSQHAEMMAHQFSNAIWVSPRATHYGLGGKYAFEPSYVRYFASLNDTYIQLLEDWHIQAKRFNHYRNWDYAWPKYYGRHSLNHELLNNISMWENHIDLKIVNHWHDLSVKASQNSWWFPDNFCWEMIFSWWGRVVSFFNSPELLAFGRIWFFFFATPAFLFSARAWHLNSLIQSMGGPSGVAVTPVKRGKVRISPHLIKKSAPIVDIKRLWSPQPDPDKPRPAYGIFGQGDEDIKDFHKQYYDDYVGQYFIPQTLYENERWLDKFAVKDNVYDHEKASGRYIFPRRNSYTTFYTFMRRDKRSQPVVPKIDNSYRFQSQISPSLSRVSTSVAYTFVGSPVWQKYEKDVVGVRPKVEENFLPKRLSKFSDYSSSWLVRPESNGPRPRLGWSSDFHSKFRSRRLRRSRITRLRSRKWNKGFDNHNPNFFRAESGLKRFKPQIPSYVVKSPPVWKLKQLQHQWHLKRYRKTLLSVTNVPSPSPALPASPVYDAFVRALASVNYPGRTTVFCQDSATQVSLDAGHDTEVYEEEVDDEVYGHNGDDDTEELNDNDVMTEKFTEATYLGLSSDRLVGVSSYLGCPFGFSETNLELAEEHNQRRLIMSYKRFRSLPSVCYSVVFPSDIISLNGRVSTVVNWGPASVDHPAYEQLFLVPYAIPRFYRRLTRLRNVLHEIDPIPTVGLKEGSDDLYRNAYADVGATDFVKVPTKLSTKLLNRLRFRRKKRRERACRKIYNEREKRKFMKPYRSGSIVTDLPLTNPWRTANAYQIYDLLGGDMLWIDQISWISDYRNRIGLNVFDRPDSDRAWNLDDEDASCLEPSMSCNLGYRWAGKKAYINALLRPIEYAGSCLDPVVTGSAGLNPVRYLVAEDLNSPPPSELESLALDFLSRRHLDGYTTWNMIMTWEVVDKLSADDSDSYRIGETSTEVPDLAREDFPHWLVELAFAGASPGDRSLEASRLRMSTSNFSKGVFMRPGPQSFDKLASFFLSDLPAAIYEKITKKPGDMVLKEGITPIKYKYKYRYQTETHKEYLIRFFSLQATEKREAYAVHSITARDLSLDVPNPTHLRLFALSEIYYPSVVQGNSIEA